ncbi:DUF2637 domain-containing protein [Nonomuraea sp. NN258]|uniref:DUF2637 domain-containing protein n=1 Tax=Nonomuraea antri TaxID=2730852 RepID=UPI0015686505|nr:DUF2637 domain-containing protein [Nonomuraea antri]NRQ34306.1 DUF2637 domain-containing protein [Nonomuraea antri]
MRPARLPALLEKPMNQHRHPLDPTRSENGANPVNDLTSGPRPLSDGEQTLISVTAAAVGVLGLVGFVISFATVMDAAKPTFGPLAFLLPLGVDLGIAVFSALDLVLARLDMRVRWLRFIPWALTAVTVYLNVAAYTSTPSGPDWFAVVAHAILPGLWIVAVEIGTHAVRKRADLANPSRRIDSIRVSRWLLSPLPTFALWRRMVLWEVRSYPEALGRERDRILAKTDLQDRYGRLWQFKASRRERALYKLGELVPASTPVRAEAVRITPPPAPERPALTAAPARKPSPRKPKPRKNTRPAVAPSEVDDLMPLGWQIAADHDARGITLTRDRLRDAIRQTGRSISTDRAGALLARLRTETGPTAQDVEREAA